MRSFLRDGRGPLEMREPKGLELTRGDSIIVYNASELRLVASRTGGDTVQEARRFVLPSGVEHICAGKDELFGRVSSPRLDGIVERIDMNGQSLGRFGAMESHPDPVIRAHLSMGTLECGGNEPWVVAAFHEEPVIRAYGPGGDSLWTVELAEFRRPEIRTVEVTGGLGIQSSDEPSDRVLTLVRIPNAHAFILQVVRIGPWVVERGRRTAHVNRRDSFLISAETGQAWYVGDSLPQLLTATRSILVAVEGDDETGVLRVSALAW